MRGCTESTVFSAGRVSRENRGIPRRISKSPARKKNFPGAENFHQVFLLRESFSHHAEAGRRQRRSRRASCQSPEGTAFSMRQLMILRLLQGRSQPQIMVVTRGSWGHTKATCSVSGRASPEQPCHVWRRFPGSPRRSRSSREKSVEKREHISYRDERTSMIARQKAGRSSGQRLETRFVSTTTGLSSHMPPALIMSSRMAA